MKNDTRQNTEEKESVTRYSVIHSFPLVYEFSKKVDSCKKTRISTKDVDNIIGRSAAMKFGFKGKSCDLKIVAQAMKNSDLFNHLKAVMNSKKRADWSDQSESSESSFNHPQRKRRSPENRRGEREGRGKRRALDPHLQESPLFQNRNCIKFLQSLGRNTSTQQRLVQQWRLTIKQFWRRFERRKRIPSKEFPSLNSVCSNQHQKDMKALQTRHCRRKDLRIQS